MKGASFAQKEKDKPMHLHLDFETFSSVDIRSGGAYRYVDSSDFEIMLAAYSIDGAPVEVFDIITETADDPMFEPRDPSHLPHELYSALMNPDCLIYAHNAQFERLCIKAMWGLDIPISRFRCVMIHGLYCGLPSSLSDVGAALRIPEDKRKLATGKTLINLFCKPGKRGRVMPWHEPEKWELFKEYCAQDVVAEMEHERLLSDTPVPPSVWREYEMDQRINDMGVRADLDLVDSAIAIAAEEEEELLEEAKQLCGLDNPKSVSQLLAWLQKEMPDEELTDLRKDTVTALLGSATGSAQRMLEIRQLISKTSTKKYDAVRNTVCSDGRIHGLFQFYGANRTGRFCLAEGSLILVRDPQGAVYEKPIEKVLLTDELWDGCSWVTHEGVVFSGDKEVITWDGVTATPEHKVWISETEKITLDEAKERKQKLWTGRCVQLQNML